VKPRVAIVCDWLISRGGAERVISEIAEVFPDAPIYTSIFNKNIFPEFKDREIHTSFIQKMPLAQKKHHLYLPFMPYAFEQFDLSKYDIVISSSHSCAKGIITKPQTLHICYCHSPMRYAWDNCHEYFAQYGLPKILHSRAKKLLHDLRIWDRLSAERTDFFVTNSSHVQKRIQKYYRKESEIIYPPVDTEKFQLSKKEGQYFLAVGRLTPYKRFDLVVETFNQLQMPLVVVGTGKEEKRLQKMAGRFVTMLGHISDDELCDMYKKATALIFPQVEDFGIIPLEAMACGKPVIALGRGGALETVIPGKTGLFFENQTVEDLKKTVLEFSALKWDSSEIRKHAEKFNKSIFREKLKNFTAEKWDIWRKTMV